jgi:hypothetical protein
MGSCKKLELFLALNELLYNNTIAEVCWKVRNILQCGRRAQYVARFCKSRRDNRVRLHHFKQLPTDGTDGYN